MRTATCSCRKVKLVCVGEPRRVYACACAECQRCTGSAFSYRVIYPKAAIASQKGEVKSWRRIGPSGGWMEQHFCPVCGSIVFMTAEVLKDAISLSAGCLEDPDFPPPQMLHWPERRHRWLCMEGIAGADRQLA
ncbi:GFA family protein [Nitratireductor sp. ZSWI3]|uniref:GFA family protein n=1 Tax=Nitratireductor sp. ZSWI3 TaxID=2966359 RepID=UPI00214FFBD2|nr:GFA family protein [Nitratireductor sp. ZSWI3]MCR4264775.1 GFA family protein [Nitratireductor sp. ZSWI3]